MSATLRQDLLIAIITAVILYLLPLLIKLPAFRTELRQLNIEISRCHRRERRHYERAKKRLWRRFWNPFSDL